MYQVTEFPVGKMQKIIHIFAAHILYHFLVCIENLFILPVCLINEKRTGQIEGNIIELKAKLGSLGGMKITLIEKTAVFAPQFYLIQCHICIPE